MSDKVKVKLPKGCGAVSHDGRSYEADKHGHASIPVDALQALQGHGVEVVIEDKKPDGKKADDKKSEDKKPDGTEPPAGE